MKDKHRPLAAHRFTSIASVVALLGAFILVLLVALSLPIIKSIYLLTLKAKTTGPSTSIVTELRFGVWGVCAYRYVFSCVQYGGTHHSILAL